MFSMDTLHPTTQTLLEQYSAGNTRALARLLTLVENSGPGSGEVIQAVYDPGRVSRRIGLTGAPGAGKSTMVNLLARGMMTRGESVAVLAVDPTSPVTGGALLGDRIRFDAPSSKAGQKPVFFRSAASRGHQGGLARTTEEMCILLEGFGYDRLLIESVGVGQVGLDIAGACDTTVVLVVPEGGDDIQAMKAGMLEVADLLVVNKADRPGAETLAGELRDAVDMRTASRNPGWEVPVVLSEGITGKGLDNVLEGIEAHHEHLMRRHGPDGLRRLRLRRIILNLLREAAHEALGGIFSQGRLPDGRMLEPLLEQVEQGLRTPLGLARELTRTLFGAPEEPPAGQE